MKRTISIILIFICILTSCAYAETDALAATLEDVYGAAQTSAESMIGSIYDMDVPGGTMTYILCEDMYICEYYSRDSVGYVWIEEEGDAAANLTLALDAARNYADSCNMYVFMMVDDDGSEALMLVPSYMGDQEGIYNNYADFSNAAITLFFEYEPDVNLTDAARDNTQIDPSDLIPSVLEEIYGSALTLDHSLFGETFEMDVPDNSLIYTLSGSEFICEYYYGETAYIWSVEESTANNNLEGALEAAEALESYYGAFILVLMGDSGNEALLLIPSLEDGETSDHVFNGFDALAATARADFAEMFAADAVVPEQQESTTVAVSTPVIPDFGAFVNGCAYEYEVDAEKNDGYIEYAYEWNQNEAAAKEYLDLLEDSCHFTLCHSEQNDDGGVHEIYIFDYDGAGSVDAFSLSEHDVEFIAVLAGIDEDDFARNSANIDLLITIDKYRDQAFVTIYAPKNVKYADTGDRTAQSLTPYAGSSSSGSGSSSSVSCSSCGGSGRCNECGGSGHIYRYASGGGSLKSGCTSCYGNGKCRRCSGTGRVS